MTAWLARPGTRWWIILVGVLAVSPCLNVGFSADDHIMRVRFLPDAGVAGFGPTRFDLFTFVQGEQQLKAAMDSGLFAWWTTPGYKLAFWRPVSSATHALDFALWPTVPMAMYAHSLVWYALLLTALASLYRRLLPDWVAGLALLFYALDDAHGPTVGYISNRNALVMSFFAIAAVWAHDRARRDGWRPGRWLSLLLMALGLLSGEGAIVGFGYLFAHALCLESGPVVRRLRVLWPYVLLGASWAIAYKLQGFGAHGSGIYLEPAAETLDYLSAATVRVPVLLGAQLVGPWSDFWLAYPPAVATGVLTFVLLVLALVGWAVWAVLRREPVARMWALGTLLACLPIAGTFPADRLLVFVGMGASGLVAMLIADVLGKTSSPDPTTTSRVPRLRRGVALGLLVIHGVLGPLLLPIRARSMDTVSHTFDSIDAVIPKDPEVRDQSWIVVVAPNDGLVSYLPFIRAGRGEPFPHTLRLLASSLQTVEVTRLDAYTLRLRSTGFLASATERMMRGLSYPFEVGETLQLSDVTITVEAITEDVRPEVITFRFAAPLEDPAHGWVSWQSTTFVPWTLPAVGQTVTIEPIDLRAMIRDALQGSDAE